MFLRTSERVGIQTEVYVTSTSVAFLGLTVFRSFFMTFALAAWSGSELLSLPVLPAMSSSHPVPAFALLGTRKDARPTH